MDPPHIQTSSLSLPWPHLVTICFHFPCPSLLSFIIPIIYPWTQGLTKFYAVRLIFPRPSGLHAMHSVSPHLQLRGLGPKWAAGRAGAAGASAAGTDLATIPTQAPTMHKFFHSTMYQQLKFSFFGVWNFRVQYWNHSVLTRNNYEPRPSGRLTPSPVYK